MGIATSMARPSPPPTKLGSAGWVVGEAIAAWVSPRGWPPPAVPWAGVPETLRRTGQANLLWVSPTQWPARTACTNLPHAGPCPYGIRRSSMLRVLGRGEAGQRSTGYRESRGPALAAADPLWPADGWWGKHVRYGYRYFHGLPQPPRGTASRNGSPRSAPQRWVSMIHWPSGASTLPRGGGRFHGVRRWS